MRQHVSSSDIRQGRNVQTCCRHLKASSGIKAARSSLVLASPQPAPLSLPPPPQPAPLSRGCFVVTVGGWDGEFTGNTSSTSTRQVIYGTLMELKFVLFPLPADRWLKTAREPRWIFFFFHPCSCRPQIRASRAPLTPPGGRDEP